MKIVLTRPETQAHNWASALEHAGFEVVRLPLIAFGPAPHPTRLSDVWAQAGSYHAAMFVSAQAVQAFFSAPGAGLWPSRCWATGPGTRDALLAQGVGAHRIDMPAQEAPQFDSEALWQVISPELKAIASVAFERLRVLIVRGAAAGDFGDQGQGRDWLSEQLKNVGIEVELVAAYQRTVATWSDAQRWDAAHATIDQAVWLLSSSQGIQHLAQLCPAQDWPRCSALATHPRIAHTALQLGFGQVVTVKPDVASVVDALGQP